VTWRSHLDRLGERSSDALFDELKAAPLAASQRRSPTRSSSLLAAYAIAGVVHLSSVLLVAASVLVWIGPWPNLFVVMAALTLPLLAWSLRPRIVAAPEELLPIALPTPCTRHTRRPSGFRANSTRTSAAPAGAQGRTSNSVSR
jgi:hypothetical protein